MQYIKKAGELYLLKISEGLWQEINIDIIGLLLKSNNKDAIVIIVDQFTKMTRLKATITIVLLDIRHSSHWGVKIHKIDLEMCGLIE